MIVVVIHIWMTAYASCIPRMHLFIKKDVFRNCFNANVFPNQNIYWNIARRSYLRGSCCFASILGLEKALREPMHALPSAVLGHRIIYASNNLNRSSLFLWIKRRCDNYHMLFFCERSLHLTLKVKIGVVVRNLMKGTLSFFHRGFYSTFKPILVVFITLNKLEIGDGFYSDVVIFVFPRMKKVNSVINACIVYSYCSNLMAEACFDLDA